MMIAILTLTSLAIVSADDGCGSISSCPQISASSPASGPCMEDHTTGNRLPAGKSVPCKFLPSQNNDTKCNVYVPAVAPSSQNTAYDSKYPDTPRNLSANYYYIPRSSANNLCYDAKLNISWRAPPNDLVRGFLLNVTYISPVEQYNISREFNITTPVDREVTFVYDCLLVHDLARYVIQVFSLPLPDEKTLHSLYANRAIDLQPSQHNHCRYRSYCFRLVVHAVYVRNSIVDVNFSSYPAEVLVKPDTEYIIDYKPMGQDSRYIKTIPHTNQTVSSDLIPNLPSGTIQIKVRASTCCHGSIKLEDKSSTGCPETKSEYITIFPSDNPHPVPATINPQVRTPLLATTTSSKMSNEPNESADSDGWSVKSGAAIVVGLLTALTITAISVIVVRRKRPNSAAAAAAAVVVDRTVPVDETGTIRPRLLLMLDIPDLGDDPLPVDHSSIRGLTTSALELLQEKVDELGSHLRESCHCEVLINSGSLLDYLGDDPLVNGLPAWRSEIPAALVVIHPQPPPANPGDELDAWLRASWDMALAERRPAGRWIGFDGTSDLPRAFHVYFSVMETIGLPRVENRINGAGVVIFPPVAFESDLISNATSHSSYEARRLNSDFDRQLNSHQTVYELWRDINRLSMEICTCFLTFNSRSRNG